MTRNLYLGADLDPIVKATSVPAALQAVGVAWRQVQFNDFRTRARAIAVELAHAVPDVVASRSSSSTARRCRATSC